MLNCHQAREHLRNPLRLLAWFVAVMAASVILFANFDASAQTKQQPIVLNINPPHVSTDKSIKYDYAIVYVRAPRYGDEKFARFAEVFNPMAIDPGADLQDIREITAALPPTSHTGMHVHELLSKGSPHPPWNF